MIMGEIKRFIRDDGIIKVSRSIKELAVKAMGLREAILKYIMEEYDVTEILADVVWTWCCVHHEDEAYNHISDAIDLVNHVIEVLNA